jgi:hypothetical protein
MMDVRTYTVYGCTILKYVIGELKAGSRYVSGKQKIGSREIEIACRQSECRQTAQADGR